MVAKVRMEEFEMTMTMEIKGKQIYSLFFFVLEIFVYHYCFLGMNLCPILRRCLHENEKRKQNGENVET